MMINNLMQKIKRRPKYYIYIIVFSFCYYMTVAYSNAYYLDDVSIIYQGDTQQFNSKDKIKYDEDILSIVSVKYADWSRCPLSEKFKEKYNNQDSIFPELNIQKVKFLKDDKKLEQSNLKLKKNKYIERIIYDDLTEDICLFYFIKNDKNEVDDILTYVIPEEKMHLSYEEMYGLAFND